VGVFYVPLDYHVAHYAKAVLDEIFGASGFQNEITWKRQTAHSDAQRYNPIHDGIFYYVKSDAAPFNHIYTAYADDYVKSHYPYTDSEGRRFGLWDMSSPHPRPRMMYVWKGYPPPPNGWRYELDNPSLRRRESSTLSCVPMRLRRWSNLFVRTLSGHCGAISASLC
jgi:adenine-specific DNA-methyltransferase